MVGAARIVTTTLLVLLIGLLVLQALAYGIGFVFDPAGNAGEFGYEAPVPVDELTLELVRLVGIGMVGGATLLVLAAILIWRAEPAGAYIAIIIGAIYVVVSLAAVIAESWWDAGFYGATGMALIVLSAAVRWLQARPSRPPMGAVRAGVWLLITILAASVAVPGAALADADDPSFRTSTYAWADVCPAGLPWTAEEPMRVPGPKPRDADDVPMYRVGDELYYRPGALAINGMKRIDAYLDTGDEEQLEQALKQADRLGRHALDLRDAWWLPFWYDYLPAGQHAPWFNAMTQGLVLSFFIRLYRATGDVTHLEAADRVFASFLRFGQAQEPWVAYVDGRGFLWLEHYPLPEPDHVLNAHLHAVFGIYEYWQATRSPAARQMLNGAVTTMRKNLPAYRRPGGVSLYGLTTRTKNPKYHEIHVWQLNLLGRISGDEYFTTMASRLRDDRRPVGRVNGRPQRHDARIVGPHCRPSLPTPVPASSGSDDPEAQQVALP